MYHKRSPNLLAGNTLILKVGDPSFILNPGRKGFKVWILKAERLFSMRLWMLIGALYQKLESIHPYERCCTRNCGVVATMKLWTYELLSLIQLLYSAQICTTPCNWLKRDCIYTSDAVWWHISTYSKILNFSSIPADRHIALVVLHCVKGHSYSAAICLVVVQHSTNRRTLCQRSLLHPHSSLHPR